MNRAQLLELEATRSLRITQPLELRAATDLGFDAIQLTGYACITNVGYEMYGGPPYGWTEIINRGAFGKTLSEAPKVDLLINHGGMPLSSTKAKRYVTTLAEDDIGLNVDALMNPAESDTRDLASKMEDGRMVEMSFAFRITRQRWEELDGSEGDPATAPVRRILEVNLAKGDVSVVNNGANDATWSTLRDLDAALTEMRSGHTLTDEQRALVQNFLAAEVRGTPEPAPAARDTLDPMVVRAYVAAGRALPAA